MTTIEPTAEEEAPQPRTNRARSISAGVLGVLAIVILLPCTLAVWARSTAFNSAKIGDAVQNALAQPAVEDGLAQWATDQIVTALDVDNTVKNLVPDQLSKLEPALSAGVTQAVDRLLTKVMSDPRVQEVIANAAERAHARLLQLLQGDGLFDGVKVVNGDVTVNMLPLIGRGLTRLQDLGLFDNLQVPDMTADGDPAQQIAALEQATGRDLPDNFGQLVVYHSETLRGAQTSLQKAQQAMIFAKRALWLLIALLVISIAGAIGFARDRWRAVLWLGLGIVGAMIVLRTLVRRVNQDAPSVAAQPGGKAAIESIVGDLSVGLMRLAGVIILIAAIAALFSMFRRHWLRSDLVIVGTVLISAVLLAVIGFSLGALALAIIVGAATWVSATRLLTP